MSAYNEKSMTLKFTFLGKDEQLYICADTDLYCPEWYKKSFNEEFISLMNQYFNTTCEGLIKILHDAFMEGHLSVLRQDSFVVFLKKSDDKMIEENRHFYQFMRTFTIRKENMA